MSSFFENKQNLLMIGQFVIIAGVSFYFHKRIKAIVYNINELHKMLLSQQEQINAQNMLLENIRLSLFGGNMQVNNSHESNTRSIREAHPPQINKPMQNEQNRPKTPPSTPVFDNRDAILKPNFQVNKNELLKKPEIPSKSLPKDDISNDFNSTLIFKSNNFIPKSVPVGTKIEVLEEDIEEEKESVKVDEEDLDAELEAELNELNETSLKTD